MTRRVRGLFAGRRFDLPGMRVTLITVGAAFVLGVGAGWLTGFAPDIYARITASPSPSPSVSASGSATPEVTLGPLAPITRELDEADTAAGLLTLEVPEAGAGTLAAVPGTAVEVEGAGPVRYVRVDVEDGLGVNRVAFTDFVLATLNDYRGWGSQGRQQFVQTDGVADIRVVLAAPATALALCGTHTDELAGGDAVPTPEPSGSATGGCEEQGIARISLYDWAAGLPVYGDDRTAARQYLLAHGVGHVLGDEVATCTSGVAEVMVEQESMPKDCTVNPWPFPDAPEPEASSPASPTASAN